MRIRRDKRHYHLRISDGERELLGWALSVAKPRGLLDTPERRALQETMAGLLTEAAGWYDPEEARLLLPLWATRHPKKDVEQTARMIGVDPKTIAGIQ
jgi:hypothetical protein